MSRLPQGWTEATVADLAGAKGLVTDGDWIESKDQNPKGAVRLVQLADIGDGDFRDRSSRFVTEETARRLRCTYLESGDLLVARMPDPLGRACVFPGLAQRAITAVDVFVWRGQDDGPDARWLMHSINSPEVRDSIASQAGGTTRQRVAGGRLKQLSLPVPPLPEQQRIAAKIDSLTAKSRRTRERLDHIPRLVEKYKQAVLAAAFRGDLTREWREANGAGAWRNTTLGAVVTIASGQTPKGIEERLSAQGDVPWFKVSSMNEPDNLAGLRTSQFKLSQLDACALGLRIVNAGSIAFPKRGGAIATNKKRKLLVGGALDLNLMVLTAKHISAEFLWWWVQKLDLATISNGSNVPQINNGDVAPLPIDVPSASEQAEIARVLGITFSWIDRLAAEATSARRLIDRLHQAVLAKAFRGELVPQDPADEPASVLLERIGTEGKASPKTRRGRKPRTAP